MSWKEDYERALVRILNDSSICEENRKLFAEFFEWQERKLKRLNRLSELDTPCYKTLRYYVTRLQNVNTWFKNKPWVDISEDDIRGVYDDLEDGRILNSRGRPFQDCQSYYNKVFKSKPFQLAGKKDLACKVVEFSKARKRKIKFVDEEGFRGLISVVSNVSHLNLFWLNWDYGENIGSVLKLRKHHLERVTSSNGNPYYLVNWEAKNLKRSRTPRRDPSVHPETVRYLDMLLPKLRDDELLFKFGHRQALKVIHTAALKSGARCKPQSELPTWKDLRAGMACHLLNCGWTLDEVKARLGHTPSSKTIDDYVTYLALDRQKSREKLETNSIEDLRHRIATGEQSTKLWMQRAESWESRFNAQQVELQSIRGDIEMLKQAVMARVVA